MTTTFTSSSSSYTSFLSYEAPLRAKMEVGGASVSACLPTVLLSLSREM